MKGKYFKFESFGTSDGDGIRGVLFLSGCPLRCVYCHNPDAWSGGLEVTVDQVLDMVRPYRAYYARGGGVTVSGGEPLMQGAFTAALLKALHGDGFHTALDTSGSFNDAYTEEIIAQSDLVLLDLKFATEEEYRKYTGGRLSDVLGFLDKCKGKRVWIRIVVIPEINDTPKLLDPYIKIIRRYSIEKVELLPFHTLGFQKYEKLGINNPLAQTSAMDAEATEILQQYLNEQLS